MSFLHSLLLSVYVCWRELLEYSKRQERSWCLTNTFSNYHEYNVRFNYKKGYYHDEQSFFFL